MNINFSTSFKTSFFLLAIFVLNGTNILAQTNSVTIKQNQMVSTTTAYAANNLSFHTVVVNGVNIFYREAGDPALPTIVLLHGFPSSSHMYRNLMSALASRYHLVAPDYPGFGLSGNPSPKDFTYSFDHLAELMTAFLDVLHINRFSLYLQDYGGPIGFRIMTKQPERVQALIIQNANMYNEGLGPDVQKIGALTKEGKIQEVEAAVDYMISYEGIKEQYLHGAAHPERISPDAYLSDQFFMEQKGRQEIQHILFKNYETNFPKYPEWQNYLRTHQPPVLVTWGKNDRIFPGAGGAAFKKDVAKAEIHLFDGGHFLLEEYSEQIAKLIDQFLQKNGIAPTIKK